MTEQELKCDYCGKIPEFMVPDSDLPEMSWRFCKKCLKIYKREERRDFRRKKREKRNYRKRTAEALERIADYLENDGAIHEFRLRHSDQYEKPLKVFIEE